MDNGLDATLIWLSVAVLLLAELKVAVCIVKVSFILGRLSCNVKMPQVDLDYFLLSANGRYLALIIFELFR